MVGVCTHTHTHTHMHAESTVPGPIPHTLVGSHTCTHTHMRTHTQALGHHAISALSPASDRGDTHSECKTICTPRALSYLYIATCTCVCVCVCVCVLTQVYDQEPRDTACSL